MVQNDPAANVGSRGSDVSRFLDDPQIRETAAYAIKKLVDLAEQKSKAQDAVERGDRNTACVLTFAMSVLFLTAVIYAGGHGILGSETVAVVFGSVVTGAFTFLSKYFGAD